MRVQIAGNHGLRAARDPVRHHDRLGGRGSAVVHRGVGDFHVGQQADLGLELEQVLQRALGDFGLVGRVGGEKLAALDQIVHGGGEVMTIGARTAEKGAGAGRPVLRRQPGEAFFHLEFAGVGRQVHRLCQQRPFRYVGEQRLHRWHADRLQHDPPVGLGDRQVTH